MKSSEPAKQKNRSGTELRLAVLLLAATLAIGALIQGWLRLRVVTREEREGEAIVSTLLTGIREQDIAARKLREDAALRMAGLPERKRQRLDDLHLELLVLVNPWTPLPEGYAPELDTVVEEYKMDARCAAVCWKMMQDCRSTGTCFPMICSAYRTQEYQQMLFDNKVVRVQLEHWCSVEEAVELAAKEVALPGTSEHQLGLAADIIDETFPYLTEWQETTPTQLWLMEHCADYGFILRYPTGTSDVTGIIYEPWHYRYVGVKFAKEITNRGITLEEYVAWRRGR